VRYQGSVAYHPVHSALNAAVMKAVASCVVGKESDSGRWCTKEMDLLEEQTDESAIRHKARDVCPITTGPRSGILIVYACASSCPFTFQNQPSASLPHIRSRTTTRPTCNNNLCTCQSPLYFVVPTLLHHPGFRL
jgi:hypothetical protein